MNAPRWSPQWQPRPRVSFGGDAPTVARLDGGYVAPPIPPDFSPPPRGLPRVEIVEPTEGWWTQAGAFGFRHTGAVPALEGGEIALTERLQLPGPPRCWWVHWFRYNRNLATEIASNGNFELRGRITYGVGGVQNVIECDVLQGIQIPVVCNSLKVDLVTYNPQPTAPYEAGEVIAGAMFGDGAGAGALPPTWTTPFEETDGGGLLILDVVVPDFARSVCLHTTQPNPANLAGSTLAFNGTLATLRLLDCQQAYQALTAERGVPIPAGTNQLRLTTAAAAGAGERFALQFFLAL